ncbi:MAG: hypothetical protein E7080_10795 [Bacteroidales bacterium]|nr:hypothetical protein [Bacteroidales bacterium]
MILILERRSRNGVATLALCLTQISHRVMGLEMEKNTNQKRGRKMLSMGGKMNDVTGLNKRKGTCLKQAPLRRCEYLSFTSGRHTLYRCRH